jgi:hypothetical protein
LDDKLDNRRKGGAMEWLMVLRIVLYVLIINWIIERLKKRKRVVRRGVTNSERLFILQNVKKDFEEIIKKMEKSEGEIFEYCYGICHAFNKEILNVAGKDIPCKALFPDFTHENAIPFGANGLEPSFWWSIRKEGHENRILFIDWMIERIRKGKEGE